MASQVLVTSNSEDRLNPMIPYIEKIAQPGRWWFAVAIFLSFFFMVGLALTRPDFNRQEIPDWRPVLALADASLGKGELYDAKTSYSRAARLASWREDWGGLLAAACGMKLLDNASGSYFNVETILVRAMMAGESRQSRAGIAEVARAFSAIGKDDAASMALSRIQTDWPEEDARFGECPYRGLLVRRPKCKRATSRISSRFTFAGLWGRWPEPDVAPDGYGESLESQGLAQRSLMRAAQEYDESDRNNRQNYDHDDIYHRGCLKSTGEPPLSMGVQ